VLHFGGKTYGPPWELSQLIVSDEPGRKTIWIDVVAYGLGKAFLARLDADGHDSVQLVNSGETAGE